MRRIVLALGLLMASAGALAAQEDERTLPPFTVVDAGGRALRSTTLGAGRRTVMVFVRPSCRPCEQLLNALTRLPDGAAGAGLVVVVEGSADAAAEFTARGLPKALANVPVVADVKGEGWAGLELNALPAVLGVEGTRIAWSHTGVPDRGLLESLMRTWLGDTAVRR